MAPLLPAGGRPPAHQPATGSVACLNNMRWDAEQQKKTQIWYTVSDMARRLAVGRTPELVISLMETRLFSVVVQSVWTGSRQPQRGLQADLPMKGCVNRQVTILDIYSRCGVPMADVSDLHELSKQPGVFASSQVCESVSQKRLQNIGLRYEVHVKKRGDVSYRPLPFDFSTGSDVIKKSMAVKSWIASVNNISNVPQTCTPMVEFEGAQQVTPAAALAHKARCGHTICVRADTCGGKRTKFLLDYPMPIELDLRFWRCPTCQKAKRSRVVCFAVLPFDITLRFPGSVV